MLRWSQFQWSIVELETVDWWCWIHPFDCASDIHIGAYFPFSLRFSSCCWMIWLFLSMIIEMFDCFLRILYCTSDIILGHIPLSFARFVWAVVWGWMISVGCLHHDFDIGSYIGAYFPIFFEYPWDRGSDQLGFRLSISLELSAIDYIRTSLHGFVEIEMDHIGFHQRSMGGSFS